MNASRMIVAVIAVAAGMSAACTRAVVYKESSPRPVVVHDHDGPPPHAPAHGYRHKHGDDNVVLVYDSKLDVYVVSGHRDCYYTAGQYFRFVDGSWEWSVNINSGWKLVANYSDVPSSLCAKHGKGKSHGKYKEKKH